MGGWYDNARRMSKILALDVAILLPPEVRTRAIQLSATLAGDPAHHLTLDEEHLPHVTLSQEFVRVDELDAVFERIDEALREAGVSGLPPPGIAA